MYTKKIARLALCTAFCSTLCTALRPAFFLRCIQ